MKLYFKIIICNDALVSNPIFHVQPFSQQIVKRRTQKRLPIQGNYQPMTTMMYVEDDLFRVNILSAQSHGVASLKQGWWYIISSWSVNDTCI